MWAASWTWSLEIYVYFWVKIGWKLFNLDTFFMSFYLSNSKDGKSVQNIYIGKIEFKMFTVSPTPIQFQRTLFFWCNSRNLKDPQVSKRVCLKLRPHTLDCWSEADLLDQIHQTSLLVRKGREGLWRTKEVWWIWSKRSASDQQSSVCGRSFNVMQNQNTTPDEGCAISPEMFVA